MAVKNSKGKFIDFLAQNHLGKAKFSSKTLGPDHKPTFETKIIFEGKEIAKAQGKTKRQAEHSAAELAFGILQKQLAKPEADTEEFTGPWPMFPKILIKCLEIANEQQDKRASNRLEQIQANTLKLYKGLLENLGEVIEEE